MEIVEYMHDNAISFAAAGAVTIFGFILANYYDKIVFRRDGLETIVSKHPTMPVQKPVVQNVGNYIEVNKKKVTNHKKNIDSKFFAKKEADVKDVGIIKIINEEEVEGGATVVKNECDITK